MFQAIFILFVASSGLVSSLDYEIKLLWNGEAIPKEDIVRISINGNFNYCLTVTIVDSNDIIAQVSGEQKHYFHLWGPVVPLEKTMCFYSPSTAQ
jgi:hypothetical protein